MSSGPVVELGKIPTNPTCFFPNSSYNRDNSSCIVLTDKTSSSRNIYTVSESVDVKSFQILHVIPGPGTRKREWLIWYWKEGRTRKAKSI
jgi:hypothetical protein